MTKLIGVLIANSALIAIAILIGAALIVSAIFLTSNNKASTTATTIQSTVAASSTVQSVTPTAKTTFISSTTAATTTAVTSTVPTAQPETWVLGGYAVGQKAGNEQGFALAMPYIIKYSNGTYRMYYNWANPSPGGTPATAIKSASSTDGIHWTVDSGYRITGNSSTSSSQYVVAGASVIQLKNGSYRMYYNGQPQPQQKSPPQWQIFSAISKDGVKFAQEGLRIGISSQTGINLAGHGKYFILPNGTYASIFSGNLNTSTAQPSSLILTTSTDGLNWGNFHSMYNLWHDPTIFVVNGTYNMYATYLTSAKGHVISSDGIHWPSSNMTSVTFQAQNGTVLTEGNSGVGDIGGSILPNGTYIMYTDWGNPSQNIAYFIKH